ncbi:MAG: MBL fold metallo-hydrolase [Candidatus Diapherotrites archaeon]|uniref:MBL fold metallo-hydrolase n=1 Tax=Candidatus Iainarchaeum sp. TaxID=3101447 RepID=A0A938YXF9_9ARCH|nr:MBL fold metallo-hydrolase [Candidatus Diapherotrites archaeon]
MDSISFTALGGCNEVGRSSFLLDTGKKILLERGIKLLPNDTLYPEPLKTNMDAVVISHAHLDHSGALPNLFVESRFLTYMTPPTLQLCKILWFDSLHIAGLESEDIPFSKEEIEKTEHYTFPVVYNRNVDIAPGTTMQFYDAGHILGSAMVKIGIGDKSFLYTGDYKVEETRLFKGADLNVGKVDYLAIESTYGDRNHPERKECEKLFVEEVQSTIDKGGWALIPAFAVGRSQEIIDVLFEHKINAPVYLDGMGQRVASATMHFPEYLKNPKFLEKALKSATWVKNNGMRAKALKKPGVIVTTAGMLTGGPILNYLKKLHKDRKSSVLLTGYQVEGTAGRTLMETNKIEIDGKLYDVSAKVEKFDFSAHASQREMIQTIKKLHPEKVLLVHGDKEVIDIFRQKIKEETGIEALVPALGKKIQLSG